VRVFDVMKFSSERKSAAALDQLLRRKAEAVERSRDWRERSEHRPLKR
jgi:hypothetical protein